MVFFLPFYKALFNNRIIPLSPFFRCYVNSFGNTETIAKTKLSLHSNLLNCKNQLLGKRNITMVVPNLQWTMEKTIASGQFDQGRGITAGRNGEIAVASTSSRHYVKIFANNGTMKRRIVTSGQGGGDKQGHSSPRDVAVSQDNSYYITDESPYVKIFDSHGNFRSSFGTQNPVNGKKSFEEGAYLYGLNIDSNDHVYIGACVVRSGNPSWYYISIHNSDGTYMSGFSMPNLHPYFIAVTPANNVIVSDWGRTYEVHLFDSNGTQLHTFASPPQCRPGDTFCPTGVCVVKDEVFVASFRGIPAVYRYSLTGNYIGCVTYDVTGPWGITIEDGGNKLLVCDGDSIKVFRP